MGCKELIESLRRTRDEKVAAIWSEAEAEAARIFAEAEARIASARADHDRRRASAESERMSQSLFLANNAARRNMLDGEQDISARLYAHARAALIELRDHEYPAVFGKMAGELPSFPWKSVKVRPDDAGLAARHFPDAEIIPDPAITGGMEAATGDNRVVILNTFEKRLERGWREIFPLMSREIYERLSMH